MGWIRACSAQSDEGSGNNPERIRGRIISVDIGGKFGESVRERHLSEQLDEFGQATGWCFELW